MHGGLISATSRVVHSKSPEKTLWVFCLLTNLKEDRTHNSDGASVLFLSSSLPGDSSSPKPAPIPCFWEVLVLLPLCIVFNDQITGGALPSFLFVGVKPHPSPGPLGQGRGGWARAESSLNSLPGLADGGFPREDPAMRDFNPPLSCIWGDEI